MQKYKTVWEPMDKNYLHYSPSEAVRATEQQMNSLKETYHNAEEETKRLESQINAFLRDGEYQSVFSILKTEQYQSHCSHNYDFYRFYKLSLAAVTEINLGQPCCLTHIKSMKEATELYQRLMFLLRRIEFDYLEQPEEAAELITTIKASYVLLGELVEQPKIMKRQKLEEGIYHLLAGFGLRNQAAMFLFYRLEKVNKAEEWAIFYCNLLLNQAELLYGKLMLEKVEQPTDETAELIALLETQIDGSKG